MAKCPAIAAMVTTIIACSGKPIHAQKFKLLEAAKKIGKAKLLEQRAAGMTNIAIGKYHGLTQEQIRRVLVHFKIIKQQVGTKPRRVT